MNILPRISKKSSLKIQIMITMALILLSSIWFALNSQPVAMRRESIPVQGVIVLSLDQALNESLAAGDYRRVNVNWEEVA